MPCNLTGPSIALVSSVCSIESTISPKQAPAMPIATIKIPEERAISKEVTPPNRQFAAGILFVSFARLRFSHARRPKWFEVNEDSICGTLRTCKTHMRHGLDWPWACPLMGMTGSTSRAQPLVGLRAVPGEASGVSLCFTPQRISRLWQLESSESAPYSTARRRLSLLRLSLGDLRGESYAIQSLKNLLPGIRRPNGL